MNRISSLAVAVLLLTACTPAQPPAAPAAPTVAAAATAVAPTVAAGATTAAKVAATAVPAAQTAAPAAAATVASAATTVAKPAAPPKPDPAVVQQGQQLIAQKGCGGCHTIPGVAGATANVGPNLAGVATRTTIAGGAVPNNGPQDLQRWILDPPAVKPGTQMPKLGLTEQEAQQIVAYLETLR
jgi:cytochrome c1